MKIANVQTLRLAGGWRQKDGDELIDASGKLPGVGSFADAKEFKFALLSQKRRFAQGLAERLLSFALGRKFFPGIGMDVPHRVEGRCSRSPQNLEALKQTVHRSFDAGAGGIVASREYDEMQMPTLKAFGDAVRDHLEASQ